MSKKKEEQQSVADESERLLAEEIESEPEEQGEEDDKPRRPRSVKAENIGAQIAQGITDGMAALAPKRIKPGSSLFDPKSPFKAKRPNLSVRLKCDVLQNGIRLNDYEDRLYDDEVTMLNSITRGGRYLNRLVEVIVSEDSGHKVIMIRYADRTVDQRMANMREFRDLRELLTKILKEQNAIVAA